MKIGNNGHGRDAMEWRTQRFSLMKITKIGYHIKSKKRHARSGGDAALQSRRTTGATSVPVVSLFQRASTASGGNSRANSNVSRCPGQNRRLSQPERRAATTIQTT